MKKIILFFVLPILIGISNVSADDTGTGTNSSPVAVVDEATVNEDTSVEIDLISNDTDIDNDTLIVTGILNMLNGMGVINGLGTGVIFTPDDNFNGTGSFDYIVSDGSLTDTGSVLVIVNGVNDAPVAVQDTATTSKNTEVEIDLTSNDTDVDGDTLIVTSIGTILNGEGEINSSGTGIVFTPDDGFKGMVNVSYNVSDGNLSDLGSILISVTEGNMPPVAVDDTSSTNEDTTVEIDVLSNDTDVDLDDLTVIGISNVVNGTGMVTSGGTGVIFTPDENFNGTGSFDYTVSDEELLDVGSVLITVSPVNDAPVAINDTASTDENTDIEVDLTSNDIDVDGDTLTVTSIGTVLNGEGEINSSGTGIVFTPDDGFKGIVNINYTVSDGELEDTGNVIISVDEENFPPVAIDDTLVTKENTSKTIDPRDNDTDPDEDELNITGVTDPSHGIVTFTSISVRYTPDEDYYGNDRFEYTISDGNGGTDTGIVRVTVNREDDDDDDDDDDDGYQFRERHVVQAVQKEFIGRFKKLKKQYRYGMRYGPSRNEYLRLKSELRDEYLGKLKEVTGPAKKYSYAGDTIRAKYYKTYEKKYGKKISKFKDSKLEIVVERIDDKIAEINAGNYSDNTKEKYNTMLLALRDLVVSYMNNDDDILDIDSLFE